MRKGGDDAGSSPRKVQGELEEDGEEDLVGLISELEESTTSRMMT
eukprot:CAMPEP_0172552500 /NCGR_PEP_ID=MMETSP1067-20121228/45404_1 /TAXON_ID=265564 ORGANISM="Thalassiosira punctigera, Strain Tpunct2005C2" /NCGR_SAMPLE_ID=MMETSP1067 /ASSEMBLY_ACC=CAM_ASM_000444 /LENGTH=44 /DNA_ID= /DNA_START= /DNA_END= /DNA_ORIENTATION=